MANNPKTIDEILAKAENAPVIQKLRDLVKTTLPNVTEIVRRGNITYTLEGKDFLKILKYKTHVDLGFANGTRISSLLLKRRGRGGNWRHLELNSTEDTNNPEIERLLKRSAELFTLKQ